MGSSDQKLIRDLVGMIDERPGWRVSRGKGKWVIYPPDQQPIMHLPHTPSDHRWYKNTMTGLRRRGWPSDLAPRP